jgi:hypothetical protein
MVFKFLRGFNDFIMQKVYFYRLMRARVGLIMLYAYFCQSRLIIGRVYFNNDECKAAFAYIALLVQSGNW